MQITPEYVRLRVETIHSRAREHDHEAAHSLEDRLHRDVLQAIADGTCDEPRACAAQAAMTQGISFQRWCG